MTVITSLLLLKVIVLGGLASWLTLALINNMTAFTAGVGALGNLMSMQPLRQPPPINTPLLSRSVENKSLHRAAFAIILVIEVIISLFLWLATIAFIQAAAGSVELAHAVLVANIALAAFAAMIFFFVLGGTWFAYHIRQEGAQISHFALIAVAIGGAILVNFTAA